MGITSFPTLRPILAAISLGLMGCAATNQPLNAPRAEANAPIVDVTAEPGEVWVGLAFSGGGMRASAFAHGMIRAIRDATATAEDPDGILSDVRMVTGVSGGSVTAAHFGLYGPAGVDGYRDTYLVKDAETYMANSPVNPVAILRGLSGGANGRGTFARFLDETLFHGATFGDLAKRSKILTWINATDVANNVTFLFTPETFDALCSDLSSLPISEAVAASAAFPLVFSPIVLEAHSEDCAYEEPDWLTTARYNPEATSTLRAHAEALESYADPDKVKYVKLLDGGITDNFGTTGLSVERAKAPEGPGPLTPAEAVRLKRMLFLVSNSAVEKDLQWTRKVAGPGGAALATSIIQSSMFAATRTAYDAMRLALSEWERDLQEFRCSLSPAEVRRLGGPKDFDCADVKLFIGEVNFEGLPEAMKEDLDKIPTRLKLKTEQVDLAVEAGRMATAQHPGFNGFLRSIGMGEGLEIPEDAVRITPVRG